MKILVMGLPGSGKTWLATRLQKNLDCAWYNADEIRRMANDWEFSDEARLRQAYRMKRLADIEKDYGRTVICDFVCPKPATRRIFNADITILLDTIDASRFADTNKIFETPDNPTFKISNLMTDDEINQFTTLLKEEYNV